VTVRRDGVAKRPARGAAVVDVDLDYRPGPAAHASGPSATPARARARLEGGHVGCGQAEAHTAGVAQPPLAVVGRNEDYVRLSAAARQPGVTVKTLGVAMLVTVCCAASRAR
jgi:hypothetical protein